MATALDIVNMALQRIGSAARIASLEEKAPEAQLGGFWYSMHRDTALASYAWPWATRRQKLQRLDVSTPPVPPVEARRSGWACVYAMPDECLTALYLWTGQRNPPAEMRAPFSVEMATNSEARVLLTDMAEAELVYVARVTDASRFPPLFAQALSYLVAADLARSLRKDEALAARLEGMWEVARARAAASAANQSQGDEAPLPDFIRARE